MKGELCKYLTKRALSRFRTVRSETQKADVELIADYEDRIIRSSSSPEVKRIAAKIFAGIKDLFAKAAEKILGSIRRTSPVIPESAKLTRRYSLPKRLTSSGTKSGAV